MAYYQNGYQAPAPYQAQPQYQQPYPQQAPQPAYAPQQVPQQVSQTAYAPQQRYNNAPQQAPRQQGEKVFYSESFIHKPMGGQMKDSVLVTTGFVEKVAVREVNTQSGTKLVANIDLTATLGDFKVRNVFGDQFVKADHRVRFHIAFWGKAAEAIQTANYAQGTLLRVGMTGFEPQSFTRQDGSIGYALNSQGFDFPQVVKEGKGHPAQQAPQQGQVQGQRQASQPAQARQSAPQPQYQQQAPAYQQQPQNYQQPQPTQNAAAGLFEDGMSSLGALTAGNPFYP